MYIHSRRTRLAVDAALASTQPGARALLLEGPPGAGKSALAEAVAAEHAAPLVVCQVHAWTDDQELFVGVDVGAAVAGDAVNVRQDGVLARVARLTQEHPLVVLLIDEMDKAQERTEALLLDWLQSGRVPVAPGKHLVTDHQRVLVVVTSNGERPLGDALMRRCRRVMMPMLPAATVVDLVVSRTGASATLIAASLRAATKVRAADRGSPPVSPSELARLVDEFALAQTADDVAESLRGWASRGTGGDGAASVEAASVWAIVIGGRRRTPGLTHRMGI